MTSISDIPFDDIQKFLLENGRNVPIDKNEAYNLVLDTLKTTQKYYPISIVEWLKAHNLIISKANIPEYKKSEILALNEKELDSLSKLLTLKSANKDHIINILKYLHKLKDEGLLTKNDNITLTGNIDTDIILLSNIDNNTLNQLDINSYSKKILDDQNFWKKRLLKRLGLSSNNKTLDYKFITKFLDNGKSFEENFDEASELYQKDNTNNKYFQVMKIIDDNKVRTPSDLLMGSDLILLILLDWFSEYGSRDAVIGRLRHHPNIKRFNVDKIIYAGNKIKLYYPITLSDNDDQDDWYATELVSGKGFTASQLVAEYIAILSNYLRNIRRDDYFDTLSDMYSEKIDFNGIKYSKNLDAYYIVLK